MTRVRNIVGGYVYHVVNRAAGRETLFHEPSDYAAFERVLAEAQLRQPLRLLAYCIMPNHFHLVVWPRPGKDSQVSDFMHWLTATHAQRWHSYYGTTGTGPVYQGRFRAFPVQTDWHFYTLLRYVERNALRAGLVRTAEAWRWSSLWWYAATHGDFTPRVAVADWPLPRPQNWLELVNTPLTDGELSAVRQCLQRGCPLGPAGWASEVAEQLGSEHTLRGPGRPRTAAATARRPA